MHTFNVEEFKLQFPLLTNQVSNSNIIYFDNAATTQKPQCVIDSYQAYYAEFNANVHRASHQLSAKSTSSFEKSRYSVQKFINAQYSEEVIWTKGTTESVNLIANSLGELIFEAGDEIILTQSEHHANIVPWQIVAQKKSLVIKIAPLTRTGVIDIEGLKQLISVKTKLMSFAHISNVVGKLNPVKNIISLCKEHNIVTIIDGAQAIAHEVVNVQNLDCDFYVFSAHKMYGPTGVGVLYGKKEYLNKMPPYQSGGEMIKKVSFDKTTFNILPFKFEAGTPNISGVVALSSAINFLLQSKMSDIINYEKELLSYCYKRLLEIKSISFLVEGVPDIPLFSFTIAGHHNHDVASFLDANNIAVRAGHHCAMPLMEYLKTEGCIRVALTAYNTFAEVDQLIKVLTVLVTNEDLVSNTLHQTRLSLNTDRKTATIESKTAIDRQWALDKFSSLKGWDSRHREIMMLGKNHSRMPKELLTENNLIEGCESKAWITFTKNNNVLHFTSDSDAKVIRGLLSVTLAAYNNQTAKYILDFDIDNYFTKLGLIQHLSPSRANGLIAIVNRIKQIAEQ